MKTTYITADYIDVRSLPEFASKDALRPSMQCIELKGDTMAATNGHTLYAIKYKYTGVSPNVLLPVDDFKRHARHTYTRGFNLTVSVGEHTTFLESVNRNGEVLRTSHRTIDERYPDWRVCIPEYLWPQTIHVNGSALLDELKALKTTYVYLSETEIRKDKARHRFKYKTPISKEERARRVKENKTRRHSDKLNLFDLSTVESPSNALRATGETVGLNPLYLAQLTKALKPTKRNDGQNEFILTYETANRACTYRDEKRILLIMPVMPNTYS